MMKKVHALHLASTMWLCLMALITNAQTPTVSLPLFISGLASPVKLTNANDNSNRLFVVEQDGKIKIIRNGVVQSKPFLDISSKTNENGEQGLLSLAFPPKYKQHGYFFIYYTDLSGNVTVARYQVSKANADSALLSSERILFNLPKPGGFTNHNGGDIFFGKDNFLYITIGDGGDGGDPFNNAQNGNVFFGKMLRVNVATNTAPYYTIPASNPYINDPNVKDEIYAVGLRNPWRWSFDRLTGDVWITDVGQDKREEVNFLTAANAKGANYGWRCYEGSIGYNLTGCGSSTNYVFPIFDYSHNLSTGGFSITGGFVYRGTQYPALQGYYLCADYITSKLWKINPNGSGGWNVVRQNCPSGIASFGEDEDGEMYAVSTSGKIYNVNVIPEPLVAAQTGIFGSTQQLIYPTLIQNNQVNILLNGSFQNVRITNMNGQIVLQQNIAHQTGVLKLILPNLNKGVYIVQLIGENAIKQEKVIVE